MRGILLFELQRMNTFLFDETKWEGITGAYGDETWKAALPKEGHDRQASA